MSPDGDYSVRPPREVWSVPAVTDQNPGARRRPPDRRKRPAKDKADKPPVADRRETDEDADDADGGEDEHTVDHLA